MPAMPFTPYSGAALRGAARGAALCPSEREAGLPAVREKHLHGVERVVAEVFAHELQLFQDVVGDGDDVAADGVGLEDVEELARAGPDQLRTRRGLEDLDAFAHDRHGIAPGVGNAPREHGDTRRRAALARLANAAHLLER